MSQLPTLQKRLLIFVTSVLLVAVSLLTAVLTYSNYRSLLRESEQKARQLANQIGYSAEFLDTLPASVEDLLAEQMRVQATIAAHYVAAAEEAGQDAKKISDALTNITKTTAIDEFWVTNETGHAYLRSMQEVDFSFSPDPEQQPQAHVFYPLLSRKTDFVNQKATVREIDNEPFKYVGVPGVDKPRIVQVGYRAAFLENIKQKVSLGALLTEFFKEDDLLAIEIRDAQGKVVSSQYSENFLSSKLRSALDSNTSIQSESSVIDDFIRVITPISLGENGERGTVWLALSMDNVHATLMTNIMTAFVLGLVVIVISALLIRYGANRISHPIRQLSGVSGKIAEGDLIAAQEFLDQVKAELPTAEGHNLRKSIERMIVDLTSLIDKVKRASIQLISASTQINAASKSHQDQVTHFTSGATEINASSKQISTTASELLKTINQVTDETQKSSSLADSGRESVSSLLLSMNDLRRASDSIAKRLSIIREKAQNISSVSEAISKIADRTNLLSLNAAIEAEKAGEYGHGFSVVAREIRRLADQTAIATIDIDEMIVEMQSSVSGGVIEMESFGREVERCTDEVDQVSSRFQNIIISVQELLPQFEKVRSGMDSQNEDARQISEAMGNLRKTAQESSESLKEFTQASQQLNEAVNSLRNEISKFKLS